jgi:hypothetical protein
MRGYRAVHPCPGAPHADGPIPVYHGLCLLELRTAQRARRVRIVLQGEPLRRRLFAVLRCARLSAVLAKLSLYGRR